MTEVLHRLFASTGAPPAWALRYLTAGLLVGAALSAAYIVLLTTGKAPESLAVVRVGSTIFGIVMLAFVSLLVPDKALFSLGLLILLAGIGLSPPYPIVGGALTAIGSILLAGAPTGDIAGWAGRRLLDPILGCAIALVATYLLWPRDRETEETVPVPAT